MNRKRLGGWSMEFENRQSKIHVQIHPQKYRGINPTRSRLSIQAITYLSMSNHRIEILIKDKFFHLQILVTEIEIVELRFDLLAHVI